MSLQINIMQGFRAIALHHLPIVCRSSGTSILEYIGKYFKFRIEKKTGDLGCFVCPLPVFFRSITNHFWQHYRFFAIHEITLNINERKYSCMIREVSWMFFRES